MIGVISDHTVVNIFLKHIISLVYIFIFWSSLSCYICEAAPYSEFNLNFDAHDPANQWRPWNPTPEVLEDRKKYEMVKSVDLTGQFPGISNYPNGMSKIYTQQQQQQQQQVQTPKENVRDPRRARPPSPPQQLQQNDWKPIYVSTSPPPPPQPVNNQKQNLPPQNFHRTTTPINQNNLNPLLPQASSLVVNSNHNHNHNHAYQNHPLNNLPDVSQWIQFAEKEKREMAAKARREKMRAAEMILKEMEENSPSTKSYMRIRMEKLMKNVHNMCTSILPANFFCHTKPKPGPELETRDLRNLF